MSLMHKPDQGKGVRLLTAGIIGLLTVALAWWLWGQSRLVVESLTKTTWRADVPAGLTVPAELTPGTAVNLLGTRTPEGARATIGTATLAQAGRSVTLEQVKLNEKIDGSQIAGLAPVSAPAAVLDVNRPLGEAPVNSELVGVSVAVAVLLIGLVIGVWLVGVRQSTVEWLIACDFEMKRVHWTSVPEVMGSTVVVIGACVLLSLLLFGADFALRAFFTAIKLL